VVGVEDDDAARAVREHVGRRWTAGELAPPPGEAWGPVAQEIARFVLGHAGPAATTNRAATR